MDTKQVGKATDGPWEVRKYSNTKVKDAEGIFTTNKQDRFPIVESVWGHDLEQSDANARLIAAAPELLAACERAIQLLKGAGANVDAEEPILKVIAKATGRE